MLDHKTTLELIAKAKAGDEEAKTVLFEENSPLIKSLIKRFLNKGIDYEDLYQLGCVGFLKAISNFNASFGVKFSTYAVPMIAGEIKRFLRDDGEIKISRSIKQLSIKINKYIEDCQREGGYTAQSIQRQTMCKQYLRPEHHLFPPKIDLENCVRYPFAICR